VLTYEPKKLLLARQRHHRAFGSVGCGASRGRRGGAVTYSAPKSRSEPKKAAGRGGI